MTNSRAQEHQIGAIDLQSMVLINYKGSILDIRNICASFNIFSDIYDKGMSCDLTIQDSLGLLEKFPIVGDEVIFLRFKTTSFDSYVDYIFSVYKVSNRTNHKANSESYVLHCVSQEKLKNLKTKVEKVYKEKPISEMIQNIYNEYLRPTPSDFPRYSKKPITVEDTKDDFYFISPKLSPLSLINLLSIEAQSSTYKSSTYMFYETSKGWFFKTIDSLLEQEPKESFHRSHSSNENKNSDGEGEDTVFPYQKILSLKFLNTPNTIASMNNGLYGNSTHVLDPIRKIFTREDFSYENNFDDITHLKGGKKIYPENSFFNSGTPEYYSAEYIVSDYGDNYANLDYIKKGKDIDLRIKNTRKYHKFGKYNTAMLGQLGNIVLEIIISGNSEMEIGDMINVFIPQTDAAVPPKNNTNLLFGDNNEAKFLITAIRHSFIASKNSYITTIQCVRDSYVKTPTEISDF
jgi:hypothetical protein